MSILIGRHINGITINSLEYAKDDNDNLFKFDTEELANSFLLSKGFTQDQINDSITFVNE